MAAYRLIGTNQTPKDLRAKITGRAKYSEDFKADGMLFAKVLLSPVPHGRVSRLDVDRALAMEGVHAVITADDVPEVSGAAEPILTNEPVYQGQPIAAVAAVDETTAANAVEALNLQMQPLEFVLDPIDSLRPGGPNARPEGNVIVDGDLTEFKWTSEEVELMEGDTFPEDIRVTDEWSHGDLEAAFAESDLIIERPLVYQSQSHHPLEPRTAMAYWQNGKLYLHCSVQSTARTRPAVASSLQMEEEDVIIIGEYCGGGFGSKIAGTVTDRIPAILSRLAGRPVMMRVTRDEETYFGRARPGLQGWAKLGFRSDGRLLASDTIMIQDGGPFGRSGDFNSAGGYISLTYQPRAQRHRGIPVHTNTPPKSAQRAPGAVQALTMVGPLVDQAARELGVDRVDILEINSPPMGAVYYTPDETPLTSSFAREAIQRGREMFGWEQKRELSGQVNGSKVTGVGMSFSPYAAGSSGFDGLLVIRPNGRVTIHSGVGNLGTHSVFDTCMAAAEVLGVPWEEVEVVWGDTSKGLPWSSVQGGSQTTHAHTRANWAAGHDAKQKLQEIAAQDLGGSPDAYDVDGARVFQTGNPSVGMTFAQAAQRAIELGGRYDGSEPSDELHEMTVEAIRNNLVGEGLVGAATDTYSHEGATRSSMITFMVVEVDRETGMVEIKECLSVADCGTVLHPRSLAAQVHGGVLQGMSGARFEHWKYDPRWGINANKRLYTAKPMTILDIPESFEFEAVDLPDPETPVGSKGIGEPPVAAGSVAVITAISDALGGIYLGRTPITPDRILNALEGGTPGYRALQTHV